MSYDWTNTPESSNVSAIKFNDKTRELDVRFKDGSEYQYSGVQPNVGNGMPFAASKGKYVWQVLRDKYPYKRV
jgi:hypothetical protein